MPGAEVGAPATLVVGTGLLGSAVVRRLRREGLPVRTAAVRWPTHAVADLGAALDHFAEERGSAPWRIAWCAGAGVTTSGAEEFAREEAVFYAFCGLVAEQCAAGRLDPGTGVLFLASSAGAVWAGATNPPFTEEHPVAPVAPYGRSKLVLESLAQDLAARSGARVAIGRITNLYGPGQDLAKPQGLVSHLCRAHVTGHPVGIYVPLDTLRDYLYVDDAAGLVVDLVDRLDRCPAATCTVKVVGAQHSVSVGALVAEANRIFRRPVRVLVATSPVAARQSRDLRVRSTVLPDLDRRTLRTLPSGFSATAADVELRMTSRRGLGAPR